MYLFYDCDRRRVFSGCACRKQSSNASLSRVISDIVVGYNGLTENVGHEFDGREFDRPSVQT